MERKIRGTVTTFLLLLTAGVGVLLWKAPELHSYALERQQEQELVEKNRQTILELMTKQTDLLSDTDQEDVLKKQLRIELPNNVSTEDVSITNDYLEQLVEVKIPGISQSYFYDYPMIGHSDHIEDITYEVGHGLGTIDITLDGVYELDVFTEGRYIYMNFVDPHDLYDHIIVVDAGHGGDDAGALQQEVQEKDIDLAIVKELKDLLDADESIGVYYTRLDDTDPSLENRVNLANVLSAELFLSVHNNSTSSGRMSAINGTEVMYRVTDRSDLSRQFSQLCLDHLLQELGSTSKGLVPGDEIYIVRNSQVPVALVEIGFLTNQRELDLLQTQDYQQKCAGALYDAIKEMLEVLHE
jgi:N-acetylmuramoyl-L-alanine amidase